MTATAAREMDELSGILARAPKYTGPVYRLINLDSAEQLSELRKNLDDSIWGLKGFNSTSVTMDGAKQYARGDAAYKIVFHVVESRNGAFIGHRSWVKTDKEVLFDKKSKFRALHPWEKGYIKEDISRDGFLHIAIVEV